MVQISDNAGNLIKKMTARHGFAGGGLRIGIKAGGCSGFSYTFAWEPAPRDGDLVFEGLDGAKVFVDPKSHRLIDGTTLDYDTSLVSRGFISTTECQEQLRLRCVVLNVICLRALRARWLGSWQ
jgi:iron-sulfur cluster assembly protein